MWRRRWPLFVTVLPSLLVLSFLFFFYFDLYSHYFPFGDDPAILAASQGPVADWFRIGFSNYFLVYPEWTSPYTDFMRPGVNLIVDSEHSVFGNRFLLYFLTFYAGQLLVVCSVVLIAGRLGLNRKWVFVTATFASIDPAFMEDGTVNLASQFDVWCGLFALLSFYLVLKRLYTLAFLVLLLAVFTKEAALYAPVAACMTIWLFVRRKLLSVAMLVPFLLWILARRFLFIGTMGGVYAANGGRFQSLLLGIVKGLMVWPTGVIGSITTRSPFQLHFADLLPLIGNFILWAVFARIAWSVLAQRPADSPMVEDSRRSTLALFIWTFGALSFGVLAGQHPRFGGSIFPLELLLLAVFCQRWKTRLLALAPLAGFLILIVAFVWHFAMALQRKNPEQARTMSRLVSAIHRFGKIGDTIYVLHSADSYSAPSYLAALAGAPVKVVILDQFEGCLTSSEESTSFAASGDRVEIQSTLPKCAKIVLRGVDPSKVRGALKGRLSRDSFSQYSFPNGRIVRTAVRNRDALLIDYGDRVNIVLAPSKPFLILHYDWKTGEYACAGQSCGDAGS